MRENLSLWMYLAQEHRARVRCLKNKRKNRRESREVWLFLRFFKGYGSETAKRSRSPSE